MPLPDDLPAVDVIIPVWNRAVDIATCLAAIGRQTYPTELMNVFVVDNGSSDNTPDVVRTFAWAKLIREPEPGSYSARNAGIRAGCSPIIAFTDSDCVPEPDWLEQGIGTVLENEDIGVAGGRIRIFQAGEDADPLVAQFEQLYALDQQRMTSGGCCMTANWFSPRVLLEQRGGFDTRLKSTADIELSKLISRSHQVVYAARAVVAHPARASREELVRKERRTIGGRWQKHREFSPGSWRRILTVEFAARIKRASLARLDFRSKIGLFDLNFRIFREQLSECNRLARGGTPTRD